jgi:hypothetical protein
LGPKKLLEKIRSQKNYEYDCVVPISGGKDSSYVLMYAVKNLSLKPLAVFFDSGFVPQTAIQNVKNICKNLNVDLIITNSKFRHQIVIEMLYISKYLRRFVNLCTYCENDIRAAVMKECFKRKIHFILWGATLFESKSLVYSKPPSRNTYGKNTIKKVMTQISKVFSLFPGSNLNLLNIWLFFYHSLRYIYFCIRENYSFGIIKGMKKLNPFLQIPFDVKNVEVLYFFDYVKYDPVRFVEALKNGIGWQSESGVNTRFDCTIHVLNNYDAIKKTGISQDGFVFATFVRSGLLLREKAMEKEDALKNDITTKAVAICKGLGFDLRDFNIN